MRNTSRNEVFSTPILSKIPGIGRLFRSERQIESKSELVILLKPIVVDNGQVWTQMADESLQRIRRLKREQ
jgi:MSHA biogenesis protein MshL